MLTLRRHLYPAIAAAAFAFAGGGAGCYAPSIEDGTLECASGNHCPRGFVCRDQGNPKLCYRTQADAAAPDVADVNAGGDVAPDGAHADTPDAAPDIKADIATTSDGGSEPTGGDAGLGSACDAGAQLRIRRLRGRRLLPRRLRRPLRSVQPARQPRHLHAGHRRRSEPERSSRLCDGPAEAVRSRRHLRRQPRLPAQGRRHGLRDLQLQPGMVTPAPTCDGLGQCLSSPARPCAPYACNGSAACFASCTTSSSARRRTAAPLAPADPRATGRPARSRPNARRNIVSTAFAATKPAPRNARPAMSAHPGSARRSPRVSRTARADPAREAACAAAGARRRPHRLHLSRRRDDLPIGQLFGDDGHRACGLQRRGKLPGPGDDVVRGFACDAAGTACLSACVSDNQCATRPAPTATAARASAGGRTARAARPPRNVRASGASTAFAATTPASRLVRPATSRATRERVGRSRAVRRTVAAPPATERAPAPATATVSKPVSVSTRDRPRVACARTGSPAAPATLWASARRC